MTLSPPAAPLLAFRSLPRQLCWLAFALPGCGGGCNESVKAPPAARPSAAPATDAAVSGEDARPTAARTNPATEALQGHLGLRLPAHAQPLFLEVMPATPGQGFDKSLLSRRFWISWGPRGLVANERSLLPHDTPKPEQLQEALRQAIPDWQDRAGVTVKSALLIVDASTDPATGRLIHAAAAAAADWRLSALVLDPQGAPMELPLPAGQPRR